MYAQPDWYMAGPATTCSLSIDKLKGVTNGLSSVIRMNLCRELLANRDKRWRVRCTYIVPLMVENVLLPKISPPG